MICRCRWPACAGWIGKPKLLKPIGCYFDDPKLYRRTLASGIDKSWRAKGVDAAAVIHEVEAYDVHAAASLKLMQAFQLRFKESVMFRPHSDVVSAAKASKPDDSVAFYLDTHRGTKGGRARYFPSTTRCGRTPSIAPGAWPSASTKASATRARC